MPKDDWGQAVSRGEVKVGSRMPEPVDGDDGSPSGLENGYGLPV